MVNLHTITEEYIKQLAAAGVPLSKQIKLQCLLIPELDHTQRQLRAEEVFRKKGATRTAVELGMCRATVYNLLESLAHDRKLSNA